MSLDQLLDLVNKSGAAGGAIFAVMWFLERKRADRLQSILESFLPTFRSANQVMRSVKRVIAGDADDDGS